jgi:hypothetical protein
MPPAYMNIISRQIKYFKVLKPLKENWINKFLSSREVWGGGQMNLQFPLKILPKGLTQTEGKHPESYG